LTGEGEKSKDSGYAGPRKNEGEEKRSSRQKKCNTWIKEKRSGVIHKERTSLSQKGGAGCAGEKKRRSLPGFEKREGRKFKVQDLSGGKKRVLTQREGGLIRGQSGEEKGAKHPHKRKRQQT